MVCRIGKYFVTCFNESGIFEIELVHLLILYRKKGPFKITTLISKFEKRQANLMNCIFVYCFFKQNYQNVKKVSFLFTLPSMLE